jgi:hypothetical protein
MPVSGITGSAGIVVEVDVDEPDDVDVASPDEAGLVDCGSVAEGLVTPTTVVADDDELPPPQPASASAATMNVVVDLLYFTGSLSSANALFERGSVTDHV